MITAAHIKCLLDLQVATNVAYFGEEWKTHWTEVAVANSIYREWAEFLDEVTTDWKIYGGGSHWDQVKAIYELVDVVHFMLCSTLIDCNTSELGEQFELMGEAEFNIPRTTNFSIVTKLFTQFMGEPNTINLGMFLSYACSYLGLDADTYMQAHKRKNDLNRLRAAGGQDYDKKKEAPLTLEF